MQVTETTLLNKIIVFNKRTSKGLTNCVPNGDHLSPSLCTGTKAASKNPKNTEKI